MFPLQSYEKHHITHPLEPLHDDTDERYFEARQQDVTPQLEDKTHRGT